MRNNYMVYMHISPNNKKYIGLTSQKAENRWRAGKGYRYNNYFYNAINKYGWNNFKHIIIAKGLSEEEAIWLEMELIKILDTTNPNKGYNVLIGGQTNKGENNPFYGKHHSTETRKLLSEQHKGMTYSQETKDKLSNMRKGEKNAMWGRKGKDNPNYGLKRSEEEKEYLSKLFGTSVKCIELNIEFNSLNKAEIFMIETYGIKFSHKTLKKTIDGNRKKDWYGEVEINGELVKLHWEYC